MIHPIHCNWVRQQCICYQEESVALTWMCRLTATSKKGRFVTLLLKTALACKREMIVTLCPKPRGCFRGKMILLIPPDLLAFKGTDALIECSFRAFCTWPSASGTLIYGGLIDIQPSETLRYKVLNNMQLIFINVSNLYNDLNIMQKNYNHTIN